MPIPIIRGGLGIGVAIHCTDIVYSIGEVITDFNIGASILVKAGLASATVIKVGDKDHNDAISVFPASTTKLVIFVGEFKDIKTIVDSAGDDWDHSNHITKVIVGVGGLTLFLGDASACEGED